MSYFYGVRGWLECNEELRALVLDVIRRNEHGNDYNAEWVHAPHQRNWTSYIFFGCDVNYPSLDAVRQQVRTIVETLSAADGSDTDWVDAHFHVDGEDGARRLTWQGRNGVFTETVRHGTAPAGRGDDPYA